LRPQGVEHAVAGEAVQLALLAEETDDAKGHGPKQALHLLLVRRRQRVGARHQGLQGLGLRAHLGHFLEDGLWHEDMDESGTRMFLVPLPDPRPRVLPGGRRKRSSAR
jgi:hypothetical protein